MMRSFRCSCVLRLGVDAEHDRLRERDELVEAERLVGAGQAAAADPEVGEAVHGRPHHRREPGDVDVGMEALALGGLDDVLELLERVVGDARRRPGRSTSRRSGRNITVNTPGLPIAKCT